MQIVPSIDVRGGIVVRGVAGRRAEYQPIESSLVASSDPESLGRTLANSNATEVYVADLDAIAGAEPDWDTFVSLIDCGLQLWIDAGIANVRQAEQMVQFADLHPQVTGIIGGLESLPDLKTMQRCLDLSTPQRFLFSLDLLDGNPITSAADWQGMGTADIAENVINLGVTRLILLDLADVGMDDGCRASPLCRSLHERFSQVSITAGGGIRGHQDIDELSSCGCAAALVSSALHNGKIKL